MEPDEPMYQNINKGRSLDDPNFLKMLNDKKEKEKLEHRLEEEHKSSVARKNILLMGGIILGSALVGASLCYAFGNRKCAKVPDVVENPGFSD